MLSTKKINNTYFNFLIKMSSLGLSGFIKLGMKSKTDSDFNLLTRGKK